MKKLYHVKFEVRCEESDIETVASGMLHSLRKDGWPNMLFAREEAVLRIVLGDVLERIEQHADAIYVRHEDRNVPLNLLPTPVALQHVCRWIRQKLE